MRIGTIHTIFRKELTDTLRDRRTLIFMMLVPMIAIPLLMTFTSKIMIRQVKKIEGERAKVVVLGIDRLPDQLRSMLTSSETVAMETESDYPGMTEKELTDSLKVGEFQAMLIVPDHFAQAIELESETDIEIRYDQAEERSDAAVDKLKSILNKYKEQVVQARLATRDVDTLLLRPFVTNTASVATAQKLAGRTIGRILPYIIILMCFLGAMYPAIDLAVGEKERGTLETLLVAPATRGEFVMGKYLVILLTGVIAGLLSMVSLTFSMNYLAKDFGDVSKMLAIQFDPQTIVLILMVVLPLAGIFAAILLSVSIFARSAKEAQSYMGALNMFLIFPAFVSFLPGVDLSYPLALIPVVNISLIVRDAISGLVEWRYVFTAFFSTVIYASLTLYFAKKWFEREEVLFRM